MSVKIRLQRKGRKKAPFYHIVIADARAPRDGRFIEKIGTYNPMTKPATIDLDREKAFDWLMKGAQPTDTARAILRFKGVYYRKHLMRGVKKGALTEEQAMVKYDEWIQAKEEKIAARFAQTAAEKAAFLAMVDGKKTAEPVEENPEDPGDIPTVENPDAEANVEATAAEETPATDAPAEEPAAEEPAADASEEEKSE